MAKHVNELFNAKAPTTKPKAAAKSGLSDKLEAWIGSKVNHNSKK